MSTGLVYLIGAGPGDPGLITVRGVEALGRCDVVLYDALAPEALLEHVRPGADVRFVGKRGGEESETQASINAQLIELGRAGHVVGRLKGGDPLLFARGAEEALALEEAGIAFEVIPGVTSPVAAAAYAGIPLTHRDLASSVLFLTGTPRDGLGPDGHDWRRLATRAGTLCVLMGMHRLREIASSLIANGRPASTPTAVVQWGTRPEQRTVVAPLDRIADEVERAALGSPAIVIIGQVVGLRERLRWFDRRPLLGWRVAVTRAREQAPALARRLRAVGAAPLVVPTIELHPPADLGPLDRAAREASRYDWVALTSANGVASFFAALDRQGLDARALGGVRVAAIGPGTAEALRERGVRADLVPGEYRGEALAEALLGASERPPRVLLPRAAVARDVFPDAIRAAGGEVDVVTAYVARRPDASTADRLRAWLAEGSVDVITLTASSTVTHLLELLGDDARERLAGVTLASIGPITTATAERAGLTVAVTASTYTLEGLVDALEQHAASHPRSG